jgi:hypothetical protein
LGVNKGAIEAFDKAIELNPNYVEAYYGKGISFGYLGDCSESWLNRQKAMEIESAIK